MISSRHLNDNYHSKTRLLNPLLGERTLNQTEQNAIGNYVENDIVTFSNKIMFNNKVYHSINYNKTSSYFISYILNNVINYGEICYFFLYKNEIFANINIYQKCHSYQKCYFSDLNISKNSVIDSFIKKSYFKDFYFRMCKTNNSTIINIVNVRSYCFLKQIHNNEYFVIDYVDSEHD